MPELREVLDSATVRGALEGLLGRGYLRHPHSAAYVESGALEAARAVSLDQGWHRDSYWGVQRVRHHRPRWLLCMYYPAAVTLEMGPTAIAPGSQYYALPADGDGSARPPAQRIRHDQVECCVTCLKRPEPGGGNPDYARDSILGSGLMSRQNAALALRMLGSHGAVAGALRQEVVDACR